MESHKLSLDLQLTVRDESMQPVSSFQIPNEVEAPDDYIEFLIKEANGVVSQREKIPFRSFTRNFMSGLDISLNNGTSYNTTSSAGAQTVQPWFNMFRCPAAVGDTNYGILVGTGSTAMKSTDFKLVYTTPHGAGLNQLNYGAMVFDQIVSSGSLRRLSFRRNFLNQNAASVTVREVGWLTWNYNSNTYFLLARDLLQYDGTDINVTVAQNQTLEVVYNFYTDVNQGFVDNFFQWWRGGASTDSAAPQVPLHGFTTTYNYFVTSNYITTGYINYGSNVWPYGIALGSDDGTVYPLSSSNWKLGNQITSGSGTGQLVYGTTLYGPFTASIASQSMTSTITRRFTNSSGGTVQIKEAGLISNAPFGLALLSRKLTGTVNLLDSQTLDVAFLLSVSSSI